MVTRRQFLRNAAMLGAGFFLPKDLTRYRFDPQVAIGPTLDPLTIPKYVTELLVPPAMPRSKEVTGKHGELVDYYEIAVRQFSQQILPDGMGRTTVWGYGPANPAGLFNAPSLTIEATLREAGAGEMDQPAGRLWRQLSCPISWQSTPPCTGPIHPAPGT